MKKKLAVVIVVAILALAATVVGICFLFLGNKSIKTTPSTLEVKKIGNDYYLVAEYNPKYEYQFKIEQQIYDEFVTIEYVNNKSNSLNLENCKINITSNGVYRFSVRFTNEGGKGKSKFSEPKVWKPSLKLANVDYSSVVFEDGNLTWDLVVGASYYNIVAVDKDMHRFEFTTNGLTCELDGLDVGVYNVFITAVSSDEKVESSEAGEGYQVTIQRPNIITEAKLLDADTLSLKCSENLQKISLHVDDVCVGYLTNFEFENGCCIFSDCAVLLSGVDFNNSIIKIKSEKNGHVLESELVCVEIDF